MAEIDIEELKRNYPDLYRELKADIADLIAATGKVPKSIKASALSPELASKLAANGLIELDANTEQILAKKAEEVTQQKLKQAAKMRLQLDDAIDRLDRQQDDINNIKKKGYGDDGMDDVMASGKVSVRWHQLY
jgi:hypothetical protein